MPLHLTVNESIPEDERCTTCRGTGYTSMCHISYSSYHRCFDCGGSGRKEDSFLDLAAKILKEAKENG